MMRSSKAHHLHSLGDDEVEIPIEEDGGEVKSDIPDSLGAINQTGYSVAFQRIYEVHGSMSPPAVDNASLLVVKISPKGDGRHTFKKFEVELELQVAPGSSSNRKSPEFAAFEPAQEGVWYINEHTIRHTDSNELEANASGQIPGGVTFGLSAKKSKSEEQQHRVLHTVEARPGYSDRVDNRPDIVTWTVLPADKADGIGDYMVIAVLIERARGCQFMIKASSKAKLSLISNAMNHWNGKSEVFLGPFGSATSSDEKRLTPPGVNEGNLQAVSSENLLQKLAFVHIPEKVAPRNLYGQDLTQETTALSALSMTTQESAEPTAKLDLLAQSKITSRYSSPQVAQSPTMISRLPQIPAQIEALKSNQANATAKPISTTPSIPNNSTRAMRHRKMAALYQRLAQLHREEAEEAGRWDEEQYADGAEMQEAQYA